MQETRKTPAAEPTAHNLPAQPISDEVLLEKYAKGDERSIADGACRAWRARWRRPSRAEQRDALGGALPRTRCSGGFVPAGRIQSAAGTDLSATLINCFVQPVGDSIAQDDDGHPGIYTALTEAAETMRRGGGVGYDFSRIRPRGAWVGSTQSSASGPVSYMRVFDRSCETVESRRRAARRADGRAALRPPGHRGVHPRQGPRRPEELQHLGRRDRRLHAGRAGRRRDRARAPRRARRGAEGGRRLPARSATAACGSTASCARATCGTRSCGRPTTTPSPACCSSTTSTATTTCRTARRSPAPTPAPSSRCRPTAAAASARST